MKIQNGKPEAPEEAIGFYTKVSGNCVHFTAKHSSNEADQRVALLTLSKGEEASLLLQGIHGAATCNALGIEPGGIPNVVFSPTNCKPFDLRDVERLVQAARLMVEADVGEEFEDLQELLGDRLAPFSDAVSVKDPIEPEEVDVTAAIDTRDAAGGGSKPIHQEGDEIVVNFAGGRHRAVLSKSGAKALNVISPPDERARSYNLNYSKGGRVEVTGKYIVGEVPREETLKVFDIVDRIGGGDTMSLKARIAKLERDSHPPVDIVSVVRAELKRQKPPQR